MATIRKITACAAAAVLLTGCGEVTFSGPAVQVANGTTAVTDLTTAPESTVSSSETVTAPESDVQSTPAPTAPPVTDPPATEPPVTDPPQTQPPQTEPPQTQPAVKSWKEAYRECLENYRSTSLTYTGAKWDLQDIDGDGIPELLISEGWAHVCGVLYYYYDNGQAKPVMCEGNAFNCGSYGYTLICPEEHLIVYDDMHMGYRSIAEFVYTPEHTAKRTLSMTEDSGAVGEESATYEKDNQTVTKAEFDAAMEANISSKNWIDAGQNYEFGDYSALN